MLRTSEKQGILLLVEIKHYLIRCHVRKLLLVVLRDDRPIQEKDVVISFGAPDYESWC